MTAANSLSSHLYTKSDNPKIVALIALQSAAIGTFNKAALGDRYPPARSTHDPTLPSGGGRPPNRIGSPKQSRIFAFGAASRCGPGRAHL